MGTLGSPTRVTYDALQLRTGLEDISALVIKPNGVEEGPIPLVEYESPLLAGRYYFDIFTSASDPSGDYTIFIFSPSTGQSTTGTKNITAPVDFGSIYQLLTSLIPTNVTGYVRDNDSISGQINDGREDHIFGLVQDSDWLSGKISDKDSLTGYIQDDSELRSGYGM